MSADNKQVKQKDKRLCRNVLIHGKCKNEHKGCEYNHDISQFNDEQRKMMIEKKKTKELSEISKTVNAQEFYPQFSVAEQDFNTEEFYQPEYQQEQSYPYMYYENEYPEMVQQMTSFGINQVDYNHSQLDMYFMHTLSQVPRHPLQYHLYYSSSPSVGSSAPNQKSIQHFFIPDDLREFLLRKNEAMLQVADTANEHPRQLPSQVHTYHTLVPLEQHSDKESPMFGYVTSVYKAVRSVDGKMYVLKRIENYLVGNEATISRIEKWQSVRHPALVSVYEAFTTKAFGDTSLVLVYDYHPLSKTLAEKFLDKEAKPVPEPVLWSFICQITAAVKVVHHAKLAVRTLDPTKILVSQTSRVRLNCIGLLDILSHDSTKPLVHLQHEDLWNFGQMILVLSCGSFSALHNMQISMDFVTRNYSNDLKSVILYLLSSPTNFKTIDDVVTMIAPKMLVEVGTHLHSEDKLEDTLQGELENGRLVRLMCKLGFINERPEFDRDPTWAETGDRYLLKLFRDYVFHQVSENGNPVIDMAHVLSCLNKLDAGIDEKIMLSSRDEQSCIIVTYRELKNCVDGTFKELLKRKEKF
ncbi:kinase-like domain-containing protein [Gorgonomyces haynaldii]|nr:kinase-like domain-containing protein [Gorgonomyces haynaldii]